jgi:hypothetical protein
MLKERKGNVVNSDRLLSGKPPLGMRENSANGRETAGTNGGTSTSNGPRT